MLKVTSPGLWYALQASQGLPRLCVYSLTPKLSQALYSESPTHTTLLPLQGFPTCLPLSHLPPPTINTSLPLKHLHKALRTMFLLCTEPLPSSQIGNYLKGKDSGGLFVSTQCDAQHGAHRHSMLRGQSAAPLGCTQRAGQ